MPRLSELITIVLGCLGTILLFNGAVSTDSGNIRGLATLGMMLIHFIVVMIALPFLITAIYKTETIPRWFRNTIITLSILNAIFMLISSNAVSGDKTGFVVSAILELLPIFFLYRRREYVMPKLVVHTN